MTDKRNPKDPHRYDDMLDLPHHQSATRPHMSLYDRAAQFSPFAALTGYDDEVKETARLTDRKIELDENSKAGLDEKLQFLTARLDSRPVISFTYFVPDALKAGGSYVTTTGTVKKIDPYQRMVVLYGANKSSDSTVIPLDDIVDISGELFCEMAQNG
ncbi:MAG: YolD-like family protein [Lachnospiraceae bacterium]|nr:YolD-like family protein [Lachnospiraceae bacterium]